MKSIYYICWKTWYEGQITPPFNWYPMSRGTSYKKRLGSLSTLSVTSELISAAYESKNSSLLDEIENNFIEDVCLSAFVDEDTEQLAIDLILRFFPDAEILRCQRVDQNTKDKILALFNNAVMKKTGQ